MAVQALIGPAIKALASGSVKKAAMGAAKGAVKDKAKNFVTGKGKKKKEKGGKGGALAKSKDESVQGEQQGGSIVASTPIVGNYRVESLPDKPDIEGKPSELSFESVNNQLDSIAGLTEVLKKTSQVKLKTANNREKAERKAAEKDKKRQKENLLEKGAGFVGGLAKGMVSKAAPFDPLKFFTQIFLGSLLLWITKNGSKIIGFLKAGLAFFNNFGKILKGAFTLLGKGIKAGLRVIGKAFPRLGKLGKSIKGIFKTAGKSIKGAFKGIGNGLKNLAKGIINKIKSLGKFLMNPFGGKKPPKGSPKGIANAAKNAAKKGGKVTNSFRRVLKQHGPEAAERFKQLVDKGMNPAKASRRVNTAIKAGKITSQPAKAVGSKIAKKAGQKSLLTLGKGALKFLKRIPVIGGLITLVVSLLSGDPISQALFKTAGAVLGGFLGSFIPIPVVGTLLGELIGEYTGDLMYHLFMGGGPEAVGKKLQEDIKGMLSMGQAALSWAGDGFERLMDGLPKFAVPGFVPFVGGKDVINPLPLLANPLSVIPKVYKAFFTRDPMNKGDVKSEEKPEEIKIQPEMTDPAPDGYREDLENEPTVGTRTRTRTTSDAVYWGPLLETIAKKESYGGSYDSIYPSTTKQRKYGGKALTEMTIAEASKWQASTTLERGSAAAGRYQFMHILSQAKSAKLKGTDMFSPENQDKMAISLIVNKREITPEMIKNDPNEAMIRLGMEWAAFPMPVDMQGKHQYVKAGQSYYAGDGRNASGATVAEMRSSLSKLGAPPVQTTPLTTTPQVRPTTPMAEAPVKVQPGIVTPATTKTPRGTTTTPQTTPSIQNPPPAAAPTGTGLTNVVPVENLQSIGGGTGEVGMTSGRGMRWGKMHRGVDIGTSGKRGYYVALKLKGKVSDVGTFDGYGKTVVITSGGKDFLFAHLAQTMVSKGQSYNGEIIGEIGNTGAGTGEHLHFEVSPAGTGGYQQDEDPMPYVKYIAIGKMGDGSSVGTSDRTPNLSIQDPSTKSPSQSGSVSPGQKSSISTPAAIRPGQTPSPVSDISQQLSYETIGGTTILMHPSGRQSGGSVGGGGRSGTPIIMGSGDVVNSYYKSQLLGFLYKQG